MAKATKEANYSVTIAEVSKELSAKERIAIKDTTASIKLDEALKEAGEILINPSYYAVLDIHNEKSDNIDYQNYIIVDKDGQSYTTGSKSFWSAFMNIASEMAGEDEEWAIIAYKRPSKNYSGKDFITCKIA